MNTHQATTQHEGATILIVEDHDELRSSLVDWLQTIFKGYAFPVAGSGEEAVTQVERNHPDIVLMDINLPKMNGIEAVRRIKSISPQTQAVMFSIYNDAAYREASMAAGANAYINKHNMNQELIPALLKLLPAQLVAKLKLDNHF